MVCASPSGNEMVTGRFSAGSNMSSFVLHRGHSDCSICQGLKTRRQEVTETI